MEKDSYAHFISFATLVTCVAHVGAMLVQFPLRDIFLRLYKNVGENLTFIKNVVKPAKNISPR